MRYLKPGCFAALLFIFGCGKPSAVEIKDVFSQPEGSKVIIQGYISLPQQLETIQLMRNGSISAVGLQLYMMTKSDATGDAVRTTFWTSDKGEPNKIKPLSSGYSWKDLVVYTEDGKSIGAGNSLKITGEVKSDQKYECAVNVSKIESP